MPAALARSAISWPTLVAASVFLPFFRPSLTSACRVLAAAITFEPSEVNSWAYRCWPVRRTDRRGTPSLRMWARVDLARRRRASFLMLMVSVLGSGSAWAYSRGAGRPAPGEAALRLLGFLANDDFVGVLHALALVGLRRTDGADLGGDLANALLVGALDQDLGLGRGGQRDAFRRHEHHRVREAQRQAEVLALHGGAVTHANQLELALKAVGHTLDHVGQDGADGAGHRDQGRLIGREHGGAVLDGDLHAGRLGQGQGALRALGADAGFLDVQFDALRQGDRLLGYAGHGRRTPSIRPRSTGLHRPRRRCAPACRS